MTAPATTATPTLLGREPAMFLNVAAAVIAMISSSIPGLLDATQQGVLNVVVSTVLGLIVAIKVKRGTWVAALMAVVQGLIAAALAFKFQLAPDVQAGIMLLVAAVAGFATRQVVDPAQPPPTIGSSALA